MIGYLLLGSGSLTAAIGLAAHLHSGHRPATAVRRLTTLTAPGHGARRLTVTARQARHELTLLRHRQEGAGLYIARLETDLRQAHRDVDGLTLQRDDSLAAVDKAGIRIADLEEQLAAYDALCAENTALRQERANLHAMRSLHPGPTPADDATALPDDLQDFIHQTDAWRAIPAGEAR